MSHPLLTKVLADALDSPGVFEDPLDDDAGLATDVIAAIPPGIADRLEAALDVCSECGLPDKGYIREGADFDEVAHEDWMRHPYVPLVDLATDASGTAGEGI